MCSNIDGNPATRSGTGRKRVYNIRADRLRFKEQSLRERFARTAKF